MLGFEGGSLELAKLASSDRSMDLVQDQHSTSPTPLNDGDVHDFADEFDETRQNLPSRMIMQAMRTSTASRS